MSCCHMVAHRGVQLRYKQKRRALSKEKVIATVSSLPPPQALLGFQFYPFSFFG